MHPALICTAVLATACASKQDAGTVRQLELTDTSLVRGRQIFDQHCYSCHLRASGGMAPKLTNKPLPRFLIRFQVRHGLGAMPAFSEKHISDEELDALVDYVDFLLEQKP